MRKLFLMVLAGALPMSMGMAQAACEAKCANLPAQHRYVENGDGTVSDACTGLQWEKKTEPSAGGLHDVDNKYLWSADDGKYSPNGSVFTVFLYGLNRDDSSVTGNGAITGCFAGHCDWRLPEYTELLGIVDQSVCVFGDRFTGVACIDAAFGPTQPYPSGGSAERAYWSATTYENARDAAVNIDFFSGTTVGGGKTFIPDYARAVRCGK